MGNEANLKGILEAAVQIAAKRREILTRLRAALESGWNQEALAELLDGALKSCNYRGLLYPKIFVERLKQMQRQE